LRGYTGRLPAYTAGWQGAYCRIARFYFSHLRKKYFPANALHGTVIGHTCGDKGKIHVRFCRRIFKKPLAKSHLKAILLKTDAGVKFY
jgi:hypothetical protein